MSETTLDLRGLDQHEAVDQLDLSVARLEPGASLVMVTSVDPVFLRNGTVPGGLVWDYLEAGPETWRIRIEKTRSGGCGCCGCGG